MKKRYLLFVLIIFLIVFSSQSIAIRLSPASARFFYDEINGINEKFVFRVTSVSNQDIVVESSVSDSLAQYIDVEVGDFFLKPGEHKDFFVKLDIPSGVDLVGVHDGLITFRKKIPSDDHSMMPVTTALGARVVVTFSYPGQYIDIVNLDREVLVNEGENAVINWRVQAKGTDVTMFVNEFVVKDREGEVVFSEVEPSRVLPLNEFFSGSSELKSETFSPGIYTIYMKSSSEDNFVEKNSTLRVGEEDINLKSFFPNNFTVGNILEFSFIIENLWNGEFRGVYGELTVEDVSMVTRSVNLGPFEEAEISNQFINLKDLDVGIYNGLLTVYFGENSKTFDVELVVLEEESSKNYFVLISGAALILLLVFLLALFLLKKVKKS